jgi:putative acetyltransferase
LKNRWNSKVLAALFTRGPGVSRGGRQRIDQWRTEFFFVLSISRESPCQDDIIRLIRQSDALMQSLYPAESNRLVDIDSLAQPHVHFVVMKRVFVDPDARGKGVARAIMEALERAAEAEGVTLMQLETGVKQPEAIALYRKLGYIERGPFGSYQPDPLSLFMEKRLA